MPTSAILAFLALACIGYIVWSKGKKKPRTQPAPVGPDWRIGPIVNGDNYSVGMPARPTMHADGSLSFDMPQAPGHVNYVQRFNPPPLGDSLTLRFRFEGGPTYGAQHPGEAATVSLMLQRKGDGWRSEGQRFWSQRIPLTNGEHEVTVPLTVEHWGDMLGVADASAFAATLRDLDNIGVTFGSPSAPTHGAFGSGRFTLLALS